MADQESSFEVNFQKSNLFRVIYAEGIYGGPTPRGMLHFAVYNERTAIPRQGIVSVDPKTMAATEKITEVRSGTVREVEADIFMDLATAVSFAAWMEKQVEILRSNMRVPDEVWEKMKTASRVTL